MSAWQKLLVVRIVATSAIATLVSNSLPECLAVGLLLFVSFMATDIMAEEGL